MQNATNYPLVRITNNASGHVFYARTHGHSTMGVATGTTPVSTNFDVPVGIEVGSSTIVVVANGIASQPVNVTVAALAATVTSTPTATPSSRPPATANSTPTATLIATPTATPSSSIMFVAQGPLADFAQAVTTVPIGLPAGV